jgi:hypothetical protein
MQADSAGCFANRHGRRPGEYPGQVALGLRIQTLDDH